MSTSEFISRLRPAELVFGMLLVLVVVVSGTALVHRYNNAFMVDVPKTGGVHHEGIVGSPRLINPLLASSDADQDAAALVYAGLMAYDASGTIVPELAESYSISEDGRTYHFVLREGLTFHDGTPLTADDVAFTVVRAQDPLIKSSKFVNWEGVDVVVESARDISFTLAAPYAPFIENTTLGILPKHIWEGLTPDEFPFSEFNTEPIGAGPYRMGSIVRGPSGIPARYELLSFDDYALGAPHIERFVLHLYRNSAELYEAYSKGVVDAAHGLNQRTREDDDSATLPGTLLRSPYSRVFAVFLNQNNQSLFLRPEVKEALALAVPKQLVVNRALNGYGTVQDGPLPPRAGSGVMQTNGTSTRMQTEQATTSDALGRARAILENAGWERDSDGLYALPGDGEDEETLRLTFSLDTANTPELREAAAVIEEAWRAFGADVELNLYDASDLTQSVLRPRRFDALVFGMVLGREPDLYAFWHSSQRNDPGLNVAQLADIEADALLEDARATTSAEARAELHAEFASVVAKTGAVIFLYAPDFLYMVRTPVYGLVLPPITDPFDRFAGVHEWYKETDRVWPFVERLLR